MLNMRTFKTLSLMLGLIAMGMGVGIYTSRYYDRTGPAAQIEGLYWPNPKQIYPFITIDHKGEEFDIARLKGKWSFLFFGYTHCPDICPVTLSIMNQVQQELEKQQIKDSIQTLFVTVDPERDDQQQLASYVTYFNKDFIGLGGSSEQVQSMTVQFGVPFFHEEPTTEGNYLVDHSASLFLTDPDARLISIFSAPHNTENIVSRFIEIKNFIEQQNQ